MRHDIHRSTATFGKKISELTRPKYILEIMLRYCNYAQKQNMGQQQFLRNPLSKSFYSQSYIVILKIETSFMLWE